MSSLNQVDISYIRECVSKNITLCAKLSCYTNKASCDDIKELLKSYSKTSDDFAKELVNSL